MRSFRLLLLFSLAALGGVVDAGAQETTHVGFLWHMHQPIYYPGETVTQTDAAGHFSFSLADVHNQRFGPYTSWPKDAIQTGSSLPHLGAQVSFSGSLMQNLNNLEAAGVNGGMWNNWDSSYNQAQSLSTSLGNPRLDLVGFGAHHPLMPLLDQRDMRMQIKLHKYVHEQTWGTDVPYSKGIFPAETAFSTRMIPALVAEGLEWAIVDNIHMDRATQNYPHTNASNLFAPNPADQINPDPAANGGAWVQLNNLWAPSQVSASFSYQPHYVQHVNPNTGAVSKMVAVPGARYEGNEDGRGGFGALQYEQVMDQYRQYNTDPNHPQFVLLHHDGDNFGGGSESYYHGNFQNMVNWASGTSNYDVTTVQDYLDRFPVNPNDVIHIEPGSWAGADNGDPEFKKWLGDPDSTGWSPDRNSWAVLTAAKNRVFTADDIAPVASMQGVLDGSGTATERAWHYLLQAEASDHWYWDGTEVWDSNVTRGSNLAVAEADQVLAGFSGTETTGPTVFHPQRESYNPGGFEWSTTAEDSDFEVWTYAYDVSGLDSVTLKYRVDADGTNPLSSFANETYAGGTEVGAWNSISMSSSDVAPPSNILAPTHRALRYGGMIEGLENELIDYYVEAIDLNGNVTRSDIQHVYVGSATSPPGGTSSVTVGPDPVQAGDPVTISFDPTGGPLAGATDVYLHYGFDDWSTVISPDPLMNFDPNAGTWDITVPVNSSASMLDVVFNDGQGTWDNNNGADWHFAVEGATAGPEFVMDGVVDANAVEIATVGGLQLFAVVEGDTLYVATSDAGEGQDVFIYLAENPGALVPANWAKAGQIAQWDAFLADENDNDYEAWNDASGTTEAATGSNGGVLEGTINLAEEFGTVPSEIYLAVGRYDSADGGALVSSLQIPASVDSNGNLDVSEFLLFQITSPYEADFDNDHDVDYDDLAMWEQHFATSDQADANGDGRSDGLDFLVWQQQLGSGVAIVAAAQTVPEPASLALLLGYPWFLTRMSSRAR